MKRSKKQKDIDPHMDYEQVKREAKKRKKKERRQHYEEQLKEMKELRELLSQEDVVSSYEGVKRFDELPISTNSKQALAEAKFEEMTAIQRQSIVPALCGQQIMGSAKTGSGKTLAFLVPLVEKLYRQNWSAQSDGVGAIVVSPTRELAMQTFEVLKVRREREIMCLCLFWSF